jgi:hypothetical protein
MADNTTVHIGENSPEQVAYKLFEHIASVEKRTLWGHQGGPHADRAYILKTYWECRRVVVAGMNPEK